MSFSNQEWNQTGSLLFRYYSVIFVLTSFCFDATCETVLAQQNSRQQNTRSAINQTTNRGATPNQTANQAVPPSRLVAKPEPMKSAPDFWANYSTDSSFPAISDRLDRKNLPMLYHFSYEQPYSTGIIDIPNMSMTPPPGMTMLPLPPYHHALSEADARLRVFREKVEADKRVVVPATPSPNETKPQTATPLRRLSSSQRVMSLDDF